MSEESVDCLPLPYNSPEEEERVLEVQTILECLQSLTDHIAALEHEHIVTNRIHKKNETHFDLGSIRYQMWLSAALQKIMSVGRELEWRHNDWHSPEETTQLPSTQEKCILDDSLNDGLAVPLEPERVWLDPYNVRLPPRIMTPDEHDSNVTIDITNKIKTIESANQDSNNEFQKKVNQLRCKLAAVREEDSYGCPTSPDTRAASILTNLKSLEENMADLKQLLALLEENIEVSPTKYVAIKDWYVKEIKLLRRVTENLKYEMSSRKDQHNNLKHAINSQKDEAKAKIFYIQSWYEKYLKKKCIFQEQKVRALQALTKMKEEADEMCGHIKKQCDEYVAQLDASKKKFEDALGKQKTLNERLQSVTKTKTIEDTLREMKPRTTHLHLHQTVTRVASPLRQKCQQCGSIGHGTRVGRQSVPKTFSV